MKVLALHGYTQNSKKFLDRLKNFFPASFRSNATWICPDGPYIVDENARGWWPLESKEIFIQPHDYLDMDTAMVNIPKGDYDMVVGFSQGAVAAMIGLDRGFFTTKKMILISPSDVMDTRYTPKENQTPVMIVTGEKDYLCPPEASEPVRKYYPNHEVHIHKGGHVIPNMKHLFEEIQIQVVDLEGNSQSVTVRLSDQLYDIIRKLIQHKNITITKESQEIPKGTTFFENKIQPGDQLVCSRHN